MRAATGVPSDEDFFVLASVSVLRVWHGGCDDGVEGASTGRARTNRGGNKGRSTLARSRMNRGHLASNHRKSQPIVLVGGVGERADPNAPLASYTCLVCAWGDPTTNRTWGQFFYKMASGVRPQWIRTFPVPEAPHTGDGLFEGEVIEVVQVCFLPQAAVVEVMEVVVVAGATVRVTSRRYNVCEIEVGALPVTCFFFWCGLHEDHARSTVESFSAKVASKNFQAQRNPSAGCMAVLSRSHKRGTFLVLPTVLP